MLRIGFINLIIISKIHPSYLKKKTFAKFGPSYRVHFDQTEKEKTNKQKFQKWFSPNFKNTCTGIGLFVIKFVDFLKIQYFNYLFSPYNSTVICILCR